MKAIASLLLLLLALLSCKPRLVYEERAVPVPIPSDTARMLIRIDCPDGSTPIVRPLALEAGKRLVLESRQDSNRLELTARTLVDTVYVPVQVSGPPIYVDRPYPVKEKGSPYSRLRNLLGNVSLLALGTALIWYLIGVVKRLK